MVTILSKSQIINIQLKKEKKKTSNIYVERAIFMSLKSFP